MSAPPVFLLPAQSPLPAFLAGFQAAWRSVFAYVLFGTYVGIGALAHDFGFSLGWMLLSTLLIWAGPAQVILISTLGAGGSAAEAGIAVSLSGVRLLPMVVALLPLLRTEQTRHKDLILPAHLTAISMWVESLRLLPGMPREQRIPFCNGLAIGLQVSALLASAVGFYLAGSLPRVFAAALLFLTPMSFLISVVRNSRLLVDRLAFALGLALGPLLAAMDVGLDLLWSGVIGGTLAYVVHRAREMAP
jgi:predicted branched-subunit amino acid permease